MQRLAGPIVLAATFLLPSARAEGLVQLSFLGSVEPLAGAPVEFEIGAFPVDSEAGERREHRLQLELHLAPATSGAELATLIADRLRRLELGVVAPEPSGDSAQLFIEAVTFVNVRLGHGLHAIVTSSHGPPTGVRFERPKLNRAAAELVVSASTAHLHSEARGLTSFELSIGADVHGAQVAGDLFKAALEANWKAERPETDVWTPVKMKDGAELTGFSLALRSQGDWRIEMRL